MDLLIADFMWCTVMSPEESHGAQLHLEPAANFASSAYQISIYEAGIPFTSFAVDDIQVEFQKLSAQGVKFTVEPVEMG